MGSWSHSSWAVRDADAAVSAASPRARTTTCGLVRRLLDVGLFGGVAALVVGTLVWATARGGRAAFDYAIFRLAGADVGRGRSPYVGHPTLALLSQDTHF